MKHSRNRNPWDILGISENASQEEIREAFKRLAMKYHPDRDSGDLETFKIINAAYNKLKNNQMVPIVKAPETKLVNLKLTLKQQIEGVNDYVDVDGVLLKVKIRPGAQVNEKIKVRGDSQNFILNIKEQAHKDFTRHGFSLIMEYELDLIEAMLGRNISIVGPTDELLEISIPAGATTGYILTIPEQGMYNRRTNKRGNLNIHLRLRVPILDTNDKIEEFITRLKNVRN
jgi:DnaJ-class molecular chaperone